MDPFSHAIVGATCAGALRLSGISTRTAIVSGALAGMAPDLDILIRSSQYPLLALKYHRHFTHALAFAPLGALLTALPLFGILRLMKLQPRFYALYLAMLLGFLSHGILDAMTNYGTHLFWPFDDQRVSWNLISIIDPVFTLVALTILLFAFIKRQRTYAVMGLIWMCSYWALGYWQREASTAYMYKLAKQRGHVIERFEVKPSFANLIVWRMQYQANGQIYVDALHRSPWAGEVLYVGESAPLLKMEQVQVAGPIEQQDLNDFAFFSDDWLSLHTEPALQKKVIADVRFSMLPQQIKPFWGVQLSSSKDEHVRFVSIGRRNLDDLPIFWKMIRGKP